MVVVLKSGIRSGNEVAIPILANRMLGIARSMPGFISNTVYIAEDSAPVSIHEWTSTGDPWARRAQPECVVAQNFGRKLPDTEYAPHFCDDPGRFAIPAVFAACGAQ